MGWDVVIAGGGLAGGLCALALLEGDPALRIAVVERNPRLGGNHTWCFHGTDIPERAGPIVEPLRVAHWPSYEVVFPDRRRRIDGGYSCVTSDRLDRVVRQRVESSGGQVLTGVAARDVDSQRVLLADGRRLDAPLILDGRGPGPIPSEADSGFQVFLGHEVIGDRPHGLVRPLLMDARVPQVSGFRFFYVLPLDAHRLLIEDTRFSDEPELDAESMRAQIRRYATGLGLGDLRIAREEQGVLPMPWRAPFPATAAPLAIGMRGGWFHPATGYTFPVALRVALAVADDAPGVVPGPALRRVAREHRVQARFAMALNRLAFRWFAPANRWRCFSRFYGLPADRIARFYALDTTLGDRARILAGRPPRGLSFRARLSRRTAA